MPELRSERKKKQVCTRIPKTKIQLDGFVKDYITGITNQWLLVAPKANPAMLEMFRDRDAFPLRNMVPWAGEFAGKYLTGAVQIMRVTGDPRLKAWLKEFVSLLISFQDEDGYLGPWSKDCHITNFTPHQGEKGMNTWDTWGHYHVMLGLILWHEETGDKKALACTIRIADMICEKYLGTHTTRLVDTGSTEMNLAPVHALCLLYRKTREKRYLDMALQIVDEFSAKSEEGAPLAGDYLYAPLAGKEFFEIPKPRWESLHPIMGLAELYWITGEDKYQEAFKRLWWSMVKLDRHNPGGFTSGERATGNPYDKSAIETCCTIAWIAMSVEMLKMTGDSVVADEIELSTLNSVVGMHSHTGRWATYNTPMDGIRQASAHNIVFQAREGSPELNCCSVNSPRGFGMISDWTLMRDKDGLALNWYGPSVISANVKRGVSVTLRQETSYPIDGDIHIRIEPSKTAEFILKLRIPYWSRETTVKVNGKPISGIKAGQYLKIERKWKKDDTIQIELDMSLHFWEGERDCEGKTSVFRGPILLTFDHRYNLELAPEGEKQVRETDQKLSCDLLKVPTLDAKRMKGKILHWNSWIPPILLLEFEATDGKTLRLCDYGSAGEGGTSYLSWLPIKNVPRKMDFSKENPLRSNCL